MPLVSVICPVFNTDASMLRAAAASVLSQTGGAQAVQGQEAVELELLLVDDGTTAPATLEALEAIAADPRVRFIRNPRNLGPAGTRNAGIRAARGSLIGFIDADDLWPEGSLAVRLSAPAGPGDCILGAFEELLPGELRVTASPLPLSEEGQLLRDDWYAWEPDQAAPGLIAGWRHLGCLLAPKEALEEVGLFDETLLYGEDWLLMVRLAAARRIVGTEKPLYILRRQHASMMTRRERLTRAFSKAQETAYSDRRLRPYRKQLRWAVVRQYKGMAVNSLANGVPLNGVRCALLAWSMDPREVPQLLTFLRAAMTRDPSRRNETARRYCNAVVTPGLA